LQGERKGETRGSREVKRSIDLEAKEWLEFVVWVTYPFPGMEI